MILHVVQQFCSQRNPPCADLVTEDSLCAYLAYLRTQPSYSRTGKPIPGSHTTKVSCLPLFCFSPQFCHALLFRLSFIQSTFDQTVKALVKLWEQQTALVPEKERWAHPRGLTLKNEMSKIEREIAAREERQAQPLSSVPYTCAQIITLNKLSELVCGAFVSFSDFIDVAAGTMQDTYDSEEFVRLADYFLRKGNTVGLKYRADHLMGEAMVQRGHDKRLVLLHHMFYKALMQDGNAIDSMVIMCKGGKTNKVNHCKNVFAARILSARIFVT